MSSAAEPPMSRDVPSLAPSTALAPLNLSELEAIYATAPVGLCCVDANLRFIRVNERLASMNGCSVADHLGRTIPEVLPRLHERIVPAYLDILRTGRTLHRFPIDGPDPGDDGRIGYWTMSLTPLRDHDGSIVGVNAVVEDISERVAAEAELARYRDELEALVEERTVELERSQAAMRQSETLVSMGTLAAGLGHDLSNVLFPIRCRLDELAAVCQAMPEATVREKESIASIRRGVDYLTQLSEALRVLSSGDESSSRPGATELGPWWSEVESLMRLILPRGTVLRFELAQDTPPVRVPAHRLTQAVLNLIQNAGDATRGRDGLVVVRVRPDSAAHRVVIEVVDNGKGLSPEAQRRAFEPFFTTKPRGRGTGMGLAIVHSLAQRAGGSVTLVPGPRGGAIASLILPAASPPIHPARSSLHAAVTLRDDARAAVALQLARSSGLSCERLRDRTPASTNLWITDAPSPQAAREFLASPNRAVVVLGEPDSGVSGPGVFIVDDPDDFVSLRAGLARAIESLTHEEESE